MAACMLAPAIFAFIYGDPELDTFVHSVLITALVGSILVYSFRVPQIALNARQLYLLTSCAWLDLSLAGALPFMISHHPMSVANSAFEAVSGITTTGATVMSNLSTVPKSVLLWRSLLQWLGAWG